MIIDQKPFFFFFFLFSSFYYSRLSCSNFSYEFAVSGAGGDAVTAAISTTLYQHRENNNVNRQNIKPFDIDNVPDKSVNSTPATMPASSMNIIIYSFYH